MGRYNCCIIWLLLLFNCTVVPDFLWSLDCSMLSSSVHGDFQARILEWVTISFSRGSSQIRYQIPVSCICRWILYHWISPGKCIVWLGWDFFKNYQIVFQSGGIILHSHKQQTHFLLPHILINIWHCQVFLFFYSNKCIFTCHGINLQINNIMAFHIFVFHFYIIVYLFSIFISSLMRCLSISFIVFLKWVYFYCLVLSSLCIYRYKSFIK